MERVQPCRKIYFVTQFVFLIMWLLLTDLASSYPTVSNSNVDVSSRNERCEPITLPLCQDIPYNETIMPNLVNHGNQGDAVLEMHQYFPLIKVRCSLDLKLFLCSVFGPQCHREHARPIPPCRSLCLSARNGCEGLMNKFGFLWPAEFDCIKFPEFGSEECFGEIAAPSEKTIDESNGGSEVTTEHQHHPVSSTAAPVLPDDKNDGDA